MALKRKYVHTQNTAVDAAGNETVIFQKSTLRDVVTSEKSSVTIEGKIIFSARCDTAANTAQKTTNAPGFSLVDGAHITVLFTKGITVNSATLSVNNSTAYPIKLNGEALKANIISANNYVVLKFENSAFQIVGGAGSMRVSQNNTTKLYLMGVPEIIDGSPSDVYLNDTVYVDDAGKQFNAQKFKGDGSNITNINATNIKSGTLSSSRLADSGAVAGTYGPPAPATVGFGDTLKFPKVTVDSKGRVTSISDVNIVLPANPDTDVKVTSTPDASRNIYFVGTNTANAETGTLLKDPGIYTDGTAGRLHMTSAWTPTVYLGSAASYVTASNYTGTAAAVATISSHLRDNLTGSGVTDKGLTANQGYQLNSRLTAVETAITNINNAITAINNKLGTQVTFSLVGDVLTITPK